MGSADLAAAAAPGITEPPAADAPGAAAAARERARHARALLAAASVPPSAAAGWFAFAERPWATFLVCMAGGAAWQSGIAGTALLGTDIPIFTAGILATSLAGGLAAGILTFLCGPHSRFSALLIACQFVSVTCNCYTVIVRR